MSIERSAYEPIPPVYTCTLSNLKLSQSEGKVYRKINHNKVNNPHLTTCYNNNNNNNTSKTTPHLTLFAAEKLSRSNTMAVMGAI